jgi:hypothetical protein
MKTKQQFIDDVMGSLDDIAGAKANDLLYEKITFRLKNGKRTIYMSRWKVLVQAACLALLLAGNIIACIHFIHPQKSNTHTTNPLTEAYFSNTNDYSYE